MTISIYTTWIVGTLNGYNIHKDGLPKSLIYGTIGLLTGVSMLNILSEIKLPIIRGSLSSIFIGSLLITGTVFCFRTPFRKINSIY